MPSSSIPLSLGLLDFADDHLDIRLADEGLRTRRRSPVGTSKVVNRPNHTTYPRSSGGPTIVSRRKVELRWREEIDGLNRTMT